MKINAHFKLGFVIVILALAHLQMKTGATTFFDPEIVAAVVLIVMGSVFVGGGKQKTSEMKSSYLDGSDDLDISA